MLKIFFIIFFSFLLNGCIFSFFKEKNSIPHLNLEHVSTEVSFNGFYRMNTILSSNISLNEDDLKKLTGLTETYQIFECVDQKKKINLESKNDYDFLAGRINRIFAKNNRFYYEIVYSSSSGSLEDYFKRYNPHILYCQYQIYFWNSSPSKSDVFEVEINSSIILKLHTI